VYFRHIDCLQQLQCPGFLPEKGKSIKEKRRPINQTAELLSGKMSAIRTKVYGNTHYKG
jgi:hypothetical protein